MSIGFHSLGKSQADLSLFFTNYRRGLISAGNMRPRWFEHKLRAANPIRVQTLIKICPELAVPFNALLASYCLVHLQAEAATPSPKAFPVLSFSVLGTKEPPPSHRKHAHM